MGNNEEEGITRRNSGNKEKSLSCREVQICDRTRMQLLEAEKTIANKDVIIKMLQNHVKKMGESYKNNMEKTEEYRFKYCQAMEQVDKKNLCPKKEKPSQKSEIKHIKRELENWKVQCETMLMEKNASHSSKCCAGANQNVDKLMKEHYDLLRNLISKIAVQRTINQNLSTSNSQCGECPYSSIRVPPTSSTKIKEVDKNSTEPVIVEKLLALNQKIDQLNEKEEKSLKELETIKHQIATVYDQAQTCAGGILKLNDSFAIDKESTINKLNSVEVLVQKNVGIQKELSEIKERIDQILLNVKQEQDKPMPATTTEKVKNASSKGCTNESCGAKAKELPLKQESDSQKLLKEHFLDLSREKQEKEEHIQWLKELSAYYKQLNDDITQVQPPKMPEAVLKSEEFSEDDEEIKQYIYKVNEDNTKLKTTISSAMSNLQTKISGLNSSLSKSQQSVSQVSLVKEKSNSKTSKVVINEGVPPKSSKMKKLMCGGCKKSSDTCVIPQENKDKTTPVDPDDGKERTPVDSYENKEKRISLDAYENKERRVSLDSYENKERRMSADPYENKERRMSGDPYENKERKTSFSGSGGKFPKSEIPVPIKQTSKSGCASASCKDKPACKESCKQKDLEPPPAPVQESPTEKSQKSDKSQNSDVDIEDIYKSVLSSCKAQCRKKDQCAMTSKAACEYDDESEDDYPPCTCSSCDCGKNNGSYASSGLSGPTDSDENCACPDQKNLISNLESYKYYLQQQLEIISSIENDIDGLHECPKSNCD